MQYEIHEYLPKAIIAVIQRNEITFYRMQWRVSGLHSGFISAEKQRTICWPVCMRPAFQSLTNPHTSLYEGFNRILPDAEKKLYKNHRSIIRYDWYPAG
jgi:hypothetical protein